MHIGQHAVGKLKKKKIITVIKKEKHYRKYIVANRQG